MESIDTDSNVVMESPYLEVSGLEFSYGEVKVLHGLDFNLSPKSIGCVMGRNGVGKTTFLRNLVGLENATAGKISINGKDSTKLEAHERACNGIGYVPQGRQIFPLLTVEENLLVALEAAGSDEKSIPVSIYDTFPVLHQMRKRREVIFPEGNSNSLRLVGPWLRGQNSSCLMSPPREFSQM